MAFCAKDGKIVTCGKNTNPLDIDGDGNIDPEDWFKTSNYGKLGKRIQESNKKPRGSQLDAAMHEIAGSIGLTSDNDNILRYVTPNMAAKHGPVFKVGSKGLKRPIHKLVEHAQEIHFGIKGATKDLPTTMSQAIYQIVHDHKKELFFRREKTHESRNRALWLKVDEDGYIVPFKSSNWKPEK